MTNVIPLQRKGTAPAKETVPSQTPTAQIVAPLPEPRPGGEAA